METLSCHSNQSKGNKKNNIFIEANVMNNSAKFQLYYSFWGVDFWIFFANLAVSKMKGLDKNYMFRTGPLKKHFCKRFVKISAFW